MSVHKIQLCILSFVYSKKPIEIKPFKKQKIQITWYQLMMGQKEGCRFFYQKDKFFVVFAQKGQKRAFLYGALNEKTLFLPQHFTG